ncbi:hypothetical protein D9M72_414110 [compost metagenome]
MAMTTPFKTPRPIGPHKAIRAKTNSIRLTRHMRLRPSRSIKLSAVAARIAPNAAIGRMRRTLPRNTSTAMRVAAATRLAICERPPTAKLTAVRESEAVTGNVPNSPAAKFAAPKPVSSRFGSTR